MANLTLWLLNRVVDWDRDSMLAALRSRHSVKLGQRVLAGSPGPQSGETVALAVNAGEHGAPGELMHEGHAQGGRTQFDEYFMPIPQKCVGAAAESKPSAFWDSHLKAGEGQARMAELRQHWANRKHDGEAVGEVLFGRASAGLPLDTMRRRARFVERSGLGSSAGNQRSCECGGVQRSGQ